MLQFMGWESVRHNLATIQQCYRWSDPTKNTHLGVTKGVRIKLLGLGSEFWMAWMSLLKVGAWRSLLQSNRDSFNICKWVYGKCSPQTCLTHSLEVQPHRGVSFCLGCFQRSLLGKRINGKIGRSRKPFAIKAFYASCSKRLSAF